jgi:asparagine synthase (glutamine-hydrolysing)
MYINSGKGFTILIKLNFNYGYKWFDKNDVFVKGYLFDQDNKLYKNDELIDYFSDIKDKKQFKKKLKDANGLFSVVIKCQNEYFVAVDKMRTFPLFYYKSNNGYIITDDTNYLKNKFKMGFDTESQDEFLACGYVTDKETLLQDVYQVQSSEYIIFDLNNYNIEKEFFFSYVTNKVFDEDIKILEQKFLSILDKLTLRLIETLDNKTVVIPLSGGYDSRLMATLLKRHKYTNIITFTYGNKNSFEVDISKKIAQKLNFQWYFVEYSEDLIGDYSKSKEFNDYYNFAHNNASCFLLQDYFAIQYLKKNKLIPNDSIIVTGHSGDFLAGSQMPWDIRYESSSKCIIKEIMHQTYKLEKPKNVKYLKSKIPNNLQDGYAYSVVENFFMNRKISRFVVNAHRIYEFFGYEHRFALWDNELTVFFRDLSPEYKYEPYFFEECLLNTLFKEYGIDIIPPDKIGRNTTFAKIKRTVKKYTPEFIINLRTKIIFTDINNINYMVKPFLENKNVKVKDTTNIYTIISNWLINKNMEKENNENKNS